MASRTSFGLGIALVALASGLAATQGFALTFNVDTEVDGPDNNPGDGICATLVGPCTLRAAIEEANALGGAHTINLPQGFYNAGDHVVTADISLLGPSGISAHDRPRVIGGGPTFLIEVGAHLSIADVGVLFGDGTAVGVAGCFQNSGELEITNSTLSACTGGAGGAIYNQGVLTMTRCEVEDSDALDRGIFGGAGGGLINLTGSATLTEVAFRRNTADLTGGAIFSNGTLSLIDCWLDDNSAGTDGSAGINAGGIAAFGVADLTRVTVSRNSAIGINADGGGILAQGNLTLKNVTIHSNTATGTGGGLFLENGTFGLVNVTIYDNSDGLATGSGATVQVVNTLFFNWPSADCALSSPITSFGHNLEAISDTCGLNATGDLPNSFPSVVTPGLFGGFGETLPLLPGSVGIDDGDTALAPPTDQRGVPRYDGDGDGTVTADIGAYEYDIFFRDGFESGDTSRWSDTVP